MTDVKDKIDMWKLVSKIKESRAKWDEINELSEEALSLFTGPSRLPFILENVEKSWKVLCSKYYITTSSYQKLEYATRKLSSLEITFPQYIVEIQDVKEDLEKHRKRIKDDLENAEAEFSLRYDMFFSEEGNLQHAIMRIPNIKKMIMEFFLYG